VEVLVDLGSKLFTTVRDVLPIALMILAFQGWVLRRPIPNLRRVLTGFLYVLLGLTLFLLGLEQALFPVGRTMAVQLTDPQFIYGTGSDATPHWHDYYGVYLFALALGFSGTIPDPALIAVALKAHQASGGAIHPWGLRVAVAGGAAIGIALGVFRIVTGTPLYYYLVPVYAVIIIQALSAPRMIVPLAFDCGGVTVSTVTVPLVAALGVGLAGTIPGRHPVLDGFGLIAFTCMFPIMTVMGYGQASAWWARRSVRRGMTEGLTVTQEESHALQADRRPGGG
jgi:Protein of unknown function (DUF1538)